MKKSLVVFSVIVASTLLPFGATSAQRQLVELPDRLVVEYKIVGQHSEPSAGKQNDEALRKCEASTGEIAVLVNKYNNTRIRRVAELDAQLTQLIEQLSQATEAERMDIMRQMETIQANKQAFAGVFVFDHAHLIERFDIWTDSNQQWNGERNWEGGGWAKCAVYGYIELEGVASGETLIDPTMVNNSTLPDLQHVA